MTFLIVAVLVIGACAAAALHLRRLHAQRLSLQREPVQLVFTMPSRDRQTEPSWERPPAEDHADAESEGVLTSARSAKAVRPKKQARFAKPAQPVSTDTVHFRRASDEALQLLPGRLEVLSGLDLVREIRLVRVPGERPEVILGREPSDSPQHVSLPSSTVSRQHARLDFSGGRWSLTNLSRTNPVVVNDEMLSNIQGHRALVDGDRIELGDVVLRFCAH
jgi:hypothetical protein